MSWGSDYGAGAPIGIQNGLMTGGGFCLCGGGGGGGSEIWWIFPNRHKVVCV